MQSCAVGTMAHHHHFTEGANERQSVADAADAVLSVRLLGALGTEGSHSEHLLR